MSKYHVFGEYWVDLRHKKIYSRHVEADSEEEAERMARVEIEAINHGLGSTIKAFSENEALRG